MSSNGKEVGYRVVKKVGKKKLLGSLFFRERCVSTVCTIIA